jgi:hypothetical protein
VNNLRTFPHRDLDHANDRVVVEEPDTKKLQKLLGTLIDATNSLSRTSRDREIKIRNFRSDRLELIDDLIVVLEDRGSQYIANSYDTEQYGIGYSPDTAISDLCSTIEDYYDLLTEEEEQLGEPLRDHLRYLRSILRARG